MSVSINNWHGQNWTLTTDHPSSSYGIPVLLDEDLSPFGPNDVVGERPMRAATVVHNWAVWARDMLTPEEAELVRKFGNDTASYYA